MISAQGKGSVFLETTFYRGRHASYCKEMLLQALMAKSIL